jgi:hypothetical protein
MRSFLRPPPRESWRTRAVAVVDTSTTSSPRASNQDVRWRPRPSAFSTAQRRCGHCRAQVSRRRYSPSVASIRIEATSWLASGAIAVAVRVLLCGSIPISIIGDGPFLLGRVKGSAADNPTSRYPFVSASSSRLC